MWYRPGTGKCAWQSIGGLSGAMYGMLLGPGGSVWGVWRTRKEEAGEGWKAQHELVEDIGARLPLRKDERRPA